MSKFGVLNGNRPFYSEHVYPACCTIWGALGDNAEYDFFGIVDPTKLIAPNRTSILHDFIDETIVYYDSYWFDKSPETHIDYNMPVVKEAGLTYDDEAVDRIKKGGYSDEDKWSTYQIIEKSIRKVIFPSVFHVLFADKNFVSLFQRRLRGYVIDNGKSNLSDHLTARGTIARGYVPTWLKKGIFFRDLGICQVCGKDISGLRSPLDEVHLDHIIPLADFGNNDPSNFQLCCRECNLGKGVTVQFERARFVPYWADE